VRSTSLSHVVAVQLIFSAVLLSETVLAQSAEETNAAREGTLTFYVGGPTAPWEVQAKAFEQRYPDVKVSIKGGFSNVLDKEIDHQLASQRLEVDAAILQTLQDFVRWKSEGRLLAYKPSGFDAMHPSFKQADGAYYGVQVIAVPYMYNTQFVQPADVPNSALDFLKEQFRGKAVTPYPADDDVTLWLFYKVVQKYGWAYMDKYMANKPNFIQGHLGEQRSIASGQNWVAIDSIFNTTAPMKKAGQPVDSHFSTVDGTPIWPLTAAIFRDAPHPNAAKLFMNFLLEPEQQALTGTWSPRTDLAPPAGYRPIFSYLVTNDYKEFLADARQVAELRKRFEQYTGPIVNAGGVR
jgi:ABC-type Fe3+ transport system substrate-binding protein